VHPELFELKALVAGRLDAHRRREIDDHLGSCAECSRHYVAMMLGSSSPKTAEAEAREGLVPTGAGSGATLVGSEGAGVQRFGIDAPLKPSAPPRPAAPRAPHNNLAALETEFQPPTSRMQMPVSASLVDAISKLRAESEAAAPAAVAVNRAPALPPANARVTTAPSVAAPEADDAMMSFSIVAPTLPDTVVQIPALESPVETPGQSAPELIVTFSPAAPRTPAIRTPTAGEPAVATVVTAPENDAVQVIPIIPSVAPAEVESSAPTRMATGRKPMLLGGAMAAAAAIVIIGVAGYKFFHSSVSQAASAAAAAAAKQVEAAAARAPAPAATATTAAAAPAPPPAPVIETRIVYVDKPASRRGEPARVVPETVLVTPSMPIAVTLPDVNLNTGSDPVVQSNSQRNATSELTRSARATAIRTSVPRP